MRTRKPPRTARVDLGLRRLASMIEADIQAMADADRDEKVFQMEEAIAWIRSTVRPLPEKK